MKKIFLMIGFIVITAGCEKDQLNENFDDIQTIQNISGTWTVVSYEDFETNSVIKKNDVDSFNGMDVTLTFTIDSLYGINTTNTVFGNFILSGRNVQMTSYGGTKVGQPEWGSMFSGIVISLESYRINLSQLRFYYNNNNNSVTLNRN